MTFTLSRRGFLKAGAGLVVQFQFLPYAFSQASAQATRPIDAWLAVDGEGRVTVFCGKVELGTGVETSMAQLVAEELDVAFDRVHLLMGDTARSVNQGPTVGSKTLQQAGPQLRRAAAEARGTHRRKTAAGLQLKIGPHEGSYPSWWKEIHAEVFGWPPRQAKIFVNNKEVSAHIDREPQSVGFVLADDGKGMEVEVR